MTDSIWAVVAGTAKTFGLTFDYVLHEISYANCILYGASLPTYESKKKDEKKKDEEVIKADDPSNKERVSKLIASFK